MRVAISSLALLLSAPTLATPFTGEPDLLPVQLAESSLLETALSSTSGTGTASSAERIFPEWSRSSSWLGFRFVEHESHVPPILPDVYSQRWHIVNSPLRGVVTDEAARHRLGITAHELDRVWQDRIVLPQQRREEEEGLESRRTAWAEREAVRAEEGRREQQGTGSTAQWDRWEQEARAGEQAQRETRTRLQHEAQQIHELVLEQQHSTKVFSDPR